MDGYPEVTQRLLISVGGRGSSSLWWLDRGFRFASWILIGPRDSPRGRNVGCMTKVEGGDHRFCFTRLGGSGTSRPLWLPIGMGCSTCVVVCCCFCCWNLAVFWLCIPVPIQTRERGRGARLSAIHGKHACYVCAWEYHHVSLGKSHPRASLAESRQRWLASHHFPFPWHGWTSWASSTASSYK